MLRIINYILIDLEILCVLVFSLMSNLKCKILLFFLIELECGIIFYYFIERALIELCLFFEYHFLQLIHWALVFQCKFSMLNKKSFELHLQIFLEDIGVIDFNEKGKHLVFS